MNLQSADGAGVSGTKIKIKNRKETESMKTRPEHVFIGYKTEDIKKSRWHKDGANNSSLHKDRANDSSLHKNDANAGGLHDTADSGLLCPVNEPTDAMFYTERPVLWKNALLQYHMTLYKQNIHKHMPRFVSSLNGDQLFVQGNYADGTSDYLVTVFIYKTGEVLIQGLDLMQWLQSDLKIIRALVENDQQAVDRSLNKSREINKTSKQRLIACASSYISSAIPQIKVSPQLYSLYLPFERNSSTNMAGIIIFTERLPGYLK